MSFADRIVRLRTGSHTLTDTEKSGDANALAAEFVQMGSELEDMPMGPPRASNLYDDCMRKRVLGVKSMARSQQWTNFSDRVTFGIGGALHYWVQNTPDVLGHRRIGWWECMACGFTVAFGRRPSYRCPKCKAKNKALEYREHSLNLRSPFYVTGHPDMFVEMVSGSIRVLEIKSMVGSQFQSLASPMISHQWQIQTYMWACSKKEGGLPIPVDPNYGYMMYISKKHTTGSLPVKVFLVQRDEALLLRVKKKLLQYKNGIENYPQCLPDLAADCARTSWTNWRAKNCPVLSQCREMA